VVFEVVGLEPREALMRKSFLALGAAVALAFGGQLVQADDGDDKGPIFCAT
jgi:hypothetical protein